MLHDTSRDPHHLHPYLQERWEYLRAVWEKTYPDGPQPFLTTTYRGKIDQEAAFRKGTSDVRFGESLHNFKPAYAFDIAFRDHDFSGLDWSWSLFEKAAEILKPTGLVWGGDWSGLRDGPHFQLPMKAEDAQEGSVPKMERVRMPEEEREEPEPEGHKLVLLRHGEVIGVHDVPGSMDVIVRYAPSRKRVYVDVREAGE